MQPCANGWRVRFRHPLAQTAVRIFLGAADVAQKHLDELNAVFLAPAHWRALPGGASEWLRSVWGGHRWAKGPAAAAQLDGAAEAELRVAHDAALRRIGELERKIRELEQLYRAAVGRKVRLGPSPTLRESCAAWLELFKGRDADHMKNVAWDLRRFVARFGGDTRLDALDGRERELDAWLRGLQAMQGPRAGKLITAGRRAQIRRHVLRFLRESGAGLNERAIPAPGRDDVRADRAPIRWLTKRQAEQLAGALAQPWADMFRVQVGLGLRPDELITLKRADFGEGLRRCTLSPLGPLTLKQGPRTLSVPERVRAIVRRRLQSGDVVFPNPRSGVAWGNAKYFDRHYRRALRATAVALPFMPDCRTGRRTCGSILLRAGRSTEDVAAMLGDNPATIREHYAAILPHEVDSSPAAI
jgi:integrase